MPDLQGWHLQIPESEFCAADADANYTLDNYLEQEERVFGELDALIAGPWAKEIVGAYSRFSTDSVSNPETIDPFRYSSWPMNASVQAWLVTQSVERQLYKLQKAGRMNEMPPILAMQSVVDSTIIVPKLITSLFDRCRNNPFYHFMEDYVVNWLSHRMRERPSQSE